MVNSTLIIITLKFTMMRKYSKHLFTSLLGLFFFGFISAQSTELQYYRFWDQRGINVFEPSKNNTATLGQSIHDVVKALTYLNNIYRPGKLLDCAAEDDENSDGKIILGQSNI